MTSFLISQEKGGQENRHCVLAFLGDSCSWNKPFQCSLSEWNDLHRLTFLRLGEPDVFGCCNLELDSKADVSLSQGPLSLLPSMDSASVKAAMVSWTVHIYNVSSALRLTRCRRVSPANNRSSSIGTCRRLMPSWCHSSTSCSAQPSSESPVLTRRPSVQRKRLAGGNTQRD